MNASCTVSTPTPSASAKPGHTLYASSLIKSMLRSGYLPHVKAWRFADPSIVADSKPDTAAYNAVLNATANLGDETGYRMIQDRLFFFQPYRLVDVTFQGYDLNSPPLKPFVMSRRFRLLFIAYSTVGLVVIEKGQVLMAAKEDVGSLIERRLLDLFIGKVDILALSTDEGLHAVCVADIIYIFDVESFMVQNMEPRCSIPLPQAGFIKDIVWRRAAKYNFLVLTKDGKLFHGKFPDPTLTELMDGIDAVESSDIGDIVVAKQNKITVFSSDLNEKMIIPLSSELWLGVPVGGATLGQNFNVGEPVDNYWDCKIKVDAIKWIVLNDDNTFSDCIVVGGYKYGEDGREEDYLLLVLKSKMGRILNPTSELVAYSNFEFYWDLSDSDCIGPPGMGPFLIFNCFRN
ncbi:hypothetical protein Gogos_015971, partial [Gossypium gossypioides]|nr:hypothetical protein [Gossypium gossypioides]